MEKSRTDLIQLYFGWAKVLSFGLGFLLICEGHASSRVIVKDTSWFRKVQYKDAILYFIKNDPKKRVVFVRGGKKVSFKFHTKESFGFDFEEVFKGHENLVYAKKAFGVLNVGFLKKPLKKYFNSEAGICSAAKLPFVANYQVRDISEISSENFYKIWDDSNCVDVLGISNSEMVSVKIANSFQGSQELISNCFSKRDLREQFLKSSTSLDFAFKFISGFETLLSLLKQGDGKTLALSCDPNPPKDGELASLDKSRKPRLMTLNVYDIVHPTSADQSLGEAINKLKWASFHEFGHESLSLPVIPSLQNNCFDEIVTSKMTEFCKLGATEFDLKIDSTVKKCLYGIESMDTATPKPINATGNLIDQRNTSDPGYASRELALASSQQTAQLIAQNANAEMFAPAPTTALDTLANETLATTSGSLAGNRERPIIATPKYEAALESTYNYFSGVSNTTSNLMAQALLPQAQAAQVTAQNGTGYAVQGGGKFNTATVASLPANVQIYQPAQYIADLTCPTDNCTPSPALVAAYNVNSGASNRLATSSGTDGNLTNPTLAVENNKAQGKITETGSQQIGPNLAQGKLDSSSAPADSAQSIGATGRSGIVPSGGGSAPAPTRSVAAVGGSQPVARSGAVTRGDSEALQILATASERLGGKYLQQIRSQYSDPNFNQQLANRGWSIQVYDGKVLKRQMGATTGIQEQFIDNGKELVRKKSGK